ncbi:LPS export ABC transporter periplasmic protein LptC [Candidatus Pelagibacter sp.]|jgi:LPS export ABC transporter protein LptC|nr:LPS export ABC transporter periplasmic protein LptC [Candidatus Pelagibacter sp.]
MNKKTIMQIIMVFLIFLISLLFYLKYFKKSSKIVKNNTVLEKMNIYPESSSTYINNIDYISSDSKGNKYQLTAELAEIKKEDPSLMFLENVIAYIYSKNSDTIKITSNFGKYNTSNYETIFLDNVIITQPGRKITGEYADFSMGKNLGTITTNVIYTGDEKILFADKIEMNLTTKDTKIFMNSSGEKVIIEGTR